MPRPRAALAHGQGCSSTLADLEAERVARATRSRQHARGPSQGGPRRGPGEALARALGSETHPLGAFVAVLISLVVIIASKPRILGTMARVSRAGPEHAGRANANAFENSKPLTSQPTPGFFWRP